MPVLIFTLFVPEPSESVQDDQVIPKGMLTAVDKALLARIGDAHLAVPEGFTVHPRVQPVLDKRREMAYEGKVDWAFGELLARPGVVEVVDLQGPVGFCAFHGGNLQYQYYRRIAHRS